MVKARPVPLYLREADPLSIIGEAWKDVERKKYLSPPHSGADGYSSLLRHNAVLTGTKVSPFRKGLLSLTMSIVWDNPEDGSSTLL